MSYHKGDRGRPQKLKYTEVEDPLLERADAVFERTRAAGATPWSVIKEHVQVEHDRLGDEEFGRVWGNSVGSVARRLLHRLTMSVPTRRGTRRYLYGHLSMAQALIPEHEKRSRRARASAATRAPRE